MHSFEHVENRTVIAFTVISGSPLFWLLENQDVILQTMFEETSGLCGEQPALWLRNFQLGCSQDINVGDWVLH